MYELDTLFKNYLHDYEKKEGQSTDQDDLPDIYRKWLYTPNEELHGVKPGQLLLRSDPDEMIDAFISYHRADLPIPVQLLDAIGDSRACEIMLCEIVSGERETTNDTRMDALELLHESGSNYVAELCMKIITGEDDEDFVDLAMDLLLARGDALKDMLFEEFSHSSEIAKDRICAVLAEMPYDKRIFDLLIDRFTDEKNDVSLYASLLQRFGDANALETLETAISKGRAKRYADFVAIKDAIECFGGKVKESPDFSGDPDYDRLNNRN